MGYDERDCLIVSSPSSDIEEVLLELFARHISHLVVMEGVVDAGDVAGAVEHGGDVVAHWRLRVSSMSYIWCSKRLSM